MNPSSTWAGSLPLSEMKLVAIYLLLVGIPLAGLAAILHAGRALHAPPAIGGEWRVEGAAADSVASLAISQSGEHVEVSLGAARLRGRLAGDSVVAERRGSAAPCARQLHARIDTAARPMRMIAELRPDAPGCAPSRFAAVHPAGGGR